MTILHGLHLWFGDICVLERGRLSTVICGVFFRLLVNVNMLGQQSLILCCSVCAPNAHGPLCCILCRARSHLKLIERRTCAHCIRMGRPGTETRRPLNNAGKSHFDLPMRVCTSALHGVLLRKDDGMPATEDDPPEAVEEDIDTCKEWGTYMNHEFMGGLDVLPHVVEMLRADLGTNATRRASAALVSRMTSRLDGMLLWLKFDSEQRLELDFSACHVVSMRGQVVHQSQCDEIQVTSQWNKQTRFASIELK